MFPHLSVIHIMLSGMANVALAFANNNMAHTFTQTCTLLKLQHIRKSMCYYTALIYIYYSS